MGTRQGNIIDGFNLMAPAYDVAADMFTLGFHRIWRNAFCSSLLKKTPKNGTILDVATGTGDTLFRCLTKRPDIRACGLDLSEGMIKIAIQKLNKNSLKFNKKIEFKIGNALSLPYSSQYFDTITICWSVRSLKPIQAALRECLRVLKPGGRIFILEHGLPELQIVRSFLNKYAQTVPLLGNKISNSKVVYPLYTTSVEEFSSGKNFVAELFEAGFTKPTYETFSGGVIYIYNAQKSLKK